MNNTQRPLLPNKEQQVPPDWSYEVMGDHNFWTARGLLAFWYSFTAPPDPPAGATFQQRDNVRRGRITSAIMLFLGTLLLVVVLPIGLFGSNHTIVGVVVSGGIWITISGVLNRRSHVNLAAVFMYLSINGGLAASILHLSLIPFHVGGALTPDDKDIFYLLVYGDVFLGAMLSPDWVVIPIVVNILFSLVELYGGHHTPALATLLASPGSLFILAFRIIQLNLLVSGVVWILGKQGQESIRRADRAEEVARLNHDLAEMQEDQVQQAESLQQMASEIIGTFYRVAQGQLEARIPFDVPVPSSEAKTFWPLVGSINTHLKRYQRAHRAERELEQLRPRLQRTAELEHLFQRIVTQQEMFRDALTKAQEGGKPLHLPMSGTPLDSFYQQLNGRCLSEPPLQSIPTLTLSHEKDKRRS